MRFSTVLTATAVGVYLLVVVGATTSLTDAAAACSTWPTCGAPTDPVSQTDLAVAWGHRIAALLVGGAVATTAWLAVTRVGRTRVTAAVLGAAGIYAVQVGIGAATATQGPTAMVPGLHLTLGVLVFGLVVLALAWHLEVTTGGDDQPIDVEPVSQPGEVPAPLSVPESRRARYRLTARAYLEMTKPRLMWLLCLVAAAGMALAAGSALDARTVVATLGGGVLAIGAAGTFNHVLERDVDRRMARTAERPLATDLVPVPNALLFGGMLTVASMGAFLTVNRLAAALGLAAILFYSVVYTKLLKPHTVQNTVIGGFAGALPALIGWAAVTNEIGVPALVLAGVIFLWTPAHFYNLALAYKEDYARGGFPMLPVVRGETVTRKHILYYLAATLVGTAGLAWVTGLGPLFAATVAVFGAAFLWLSVDLHHRQTTAAAFRAFHASNAFLGALLLAIVVDALVV